MSLKRRIFTEEFKQQVLREVQAGKPVAQAARGHDLHSNLIGEWQKLHEQYAPGASRATATPTPRRPESPNSSG